MLSTTQQCIHSILSSSQCTTIGHVVQLMPIPYKKHQNATP